MNYYLLFGLALVGLTMFFVGCVAAVRERNRARTQGCARTPPRNLPQTAIVEGWILEWQAEQPGG